MEKYEIREDQTYLQNRNRLIDQGYVMGISALPMFYIHLKDPEHLDVVYKETQKTINALERCIEEYNF